MPDTLQKASGPLPAGEDAAVLFDSMANPQAVQALPWGTIIQLLLQLLGTIIV